MHFAWKKSKEQFSSRFNRIDIAGFWGKELIWPEIRDLLPIWSTRSRLMTVNFLETHQESDFLRFILFVVMV